jgi:hypothetical protein
MIRIVCALLIIGLSVGAVCPQKSKPWTEWSKKEVEKTLNDSPWGQTQSEVEVSPSAASSSAITQVAATGAANRDLSRSGESGESKPATSLKYRMRLLTAKPIREAFARQVILSQEKPAEELVKQLQSFVDRDFSDYIIIAVTVETNDKRSAGMLVSAFTRATADELKPNTFLERRDGKRVVLQDYRGPTDNMGAKFIFPRTVEGQPFLTDEKDNVRFVAQFSEKLKLNARYKVSEMGYNGKLEY